MKLTPKIKALLLHSCKMTGSYDPEIVLPYIEEQLVGKEYKAMESFLKWAHEGFGHGNIEQRWEEWRNDPKKG